MSHFNHPCITTPHASLPLYILTFTPFPSFVHTLRNIHTFTVHLSPPLFYPLAFLSVPFLLGYTYPLLLPRINHTERDLLYASIMLSKILSLVFPIKHAIYIPVKHYTSLSSDRIGLASLRMKTVISSSPLHEFYTRSLAQGVDVMHSTRLGV